MLGILLNVDIEEFTSFVELIFVYFVPMVKWTSVDYRRHSDSVVRWLFSPVSVCGCVCLSSFLNRLGVFIATQLNSTSSCRHVHSVNNCHLSMNVVTQLTQFVGRDVKNKNTTDLAVRCSTGPVELS